jgi:hypothetical protein
LIIKHLKISKEELVEMQWRLFLPFAVSDLMPSSIYLPEVNTSIEKPLQIFLTVLRGWS